jgi:hypothetical protein
MTVPKSQARKTTHDALLPNLIAKRDFSELLNTVVQSMISMFAFASLLSDWPTEIRVELQWIRQIG